MKNILFCDFNGVISYNKFWDTLSDPNHSLNKYHDSIRSVFFDPEINISNRWMLGDLTSESVHQIFARETGVSYEELFSIFKTECQNIDISKKILTKIENLPKNYIRILSTGNMDSFDRFTLPSNPSLTKAFDRIDNSFNVKMLKTTNNGQYFIKTAAEYEIPLSNCVVIDDSQEVCDVFTYLGGQSFCVTTEANVLNALSKL